MIIVCAGTLIKQPLPLILLNFNLCIVLCVCLGFGALCSAYCFTNPLSIPCTQSPVRRLFTNRFTGSVEALSNLAELANLCVGQ